MQDMSTNVQLIWRKIEHLRRMRNYLDYSLAETLQLLPISDWHQLTPKHHETLAAFRVRFNEFQEHLGKLMRSIAREEEESTEPFSFVLLYMEKLGILDRVEEWEMIRELRNAVNHEYEENVLNCEACTLPAFHSNNRASRNRRKNNQLIEIASLTRRTFLSA